MAEYINYNETSIANLPLAEDINMNDYIIVQPQDFNNKTCILQFKNLIFGLDNVTFANQFTQNTTNISILSSDVATINSNIDILSSNGATVNDLNTINSSVSTISTITDMLLTDTTYLSSRINEVYVKSKADQRTYTTSNDSTKIVCNVDANYVSVYGEYDTAITKNTLNASLETTIIGNNALIDDGSSSGRSISINTGVLQNPIITTSLMITNGYTTNKINGNIDIRTIESKLNGNGDIVLVFSLDNTTSNNLSIKIHFNATYFVADGLPIISITENPASDDDVTEESSE